MTNYILALSTFLVTFYFIISKKLDMAIASFAGALVMVILGMGFGFYSQEEAFGAIDFNMIGLLAGMMVVVSVCKKTGFFSYVAIKTAKASRGSPLRLMVMMGCVTAFLSMALDNVTTIILVIPITILICDILGISPLPTIITEIVLSNIGGVGTMVGDPPNMMIASSAGFAFNDFLKHLLPIVLMAMVLSLAILCVLFRKDIKKKPLDFRPILQINERAAIRDEKSLRKVTLSLIIVFVLFVIQKKFALHHSLVALIGAGIVLVLVRPDLDEVMKDINWPIFVFFASLFVLVGGLEKVGLLNIAARRVSALATANYNFVKIFILWVSAAVSSLVGAIPFTTAIIPVIKQMGAFGFDIDTLWWILALGVGFGANGTPIGSLAGVVGLSMSEKTHTPIDFKMWLKTATVIMLVTIIFVSLLIVII